MTPYQLFFFPYGYKMGQKHGIPSCHYQSRVVKSILTSGQPEVQMWELDGDEGERVEKKEAWSATWKLPRWRNWPAGK